MLLLLCAPAEEGEGEGEGGEAVGTELQQLSRPGSALWPRTRSLTAFLGQTLHSHSHPPSKVRDSLALLGFRTTVPKAGECRAGSHLPGPGTRFPPAVLECQGIDPPPPAGCFSDANQTFRAQTVGGQ